MSQARARGLRVDIRVVRAVIAAVVLIAAFVGLSLAAAAGAPKLLATNAELDTQRSSTERAIQRIYAAGIDQLKTTRSLKLAITDAQAAAIYTKYSDQLSALRRSALEAVGAANGLAADASTQYAQQAATRLDAALPSSPPVMLAPRLYAIVERMGQLTSQLTDQGIREMTQATPPSSSPSSSPTPTSSPRPSTSPSPSPTR
jgi:hypothetical protein